MSAFVPSAAVLSALTEALIPVVYQAGAAIMDIYASDFVVERKDDQSPVTAADAAGEKIIVAALSRLTPDLPVVAEEAAAAGQIPDIGTGPFWLVDPLDGTKEFVRRNGEFTVNIGLIVDRQPVLGVVQAPALGTLYAGWVAQDGSRACFREGAAGRQDIQCRQPPAEGLVVLSSRSHATSEALSAYLQDKTVASIINAGSSLKFCRIAEGEADLYARFGPTSEWDTAAAHAVLRAAGGRLTLDDGGPFLYGKAPDFRNPHFIASGRGMA